MYACLHQPASPTADSSRLEELAASFAPRIEVTAPGTVVFSIDGLGRLIGPPAVVASEIARRGAEAGLVASLAVASTPDAAVLAATHLPGCTLIPPGEERQRLGGIRLEEMALPDALAGTLHRWGLRTLEEVAALPPIGLAERLGEEGLRLYDLAHGRARRPLRLAPPATSYTESLELEEPVSNLEPLLFLLARLLNELCRRLQSQSSATNRLTTVLTLADRSTHMRILELPVPQNGGPPLLKLLELDLEAHPPAAPVMAIQLALQPVRPRAMQGGLFVPQAPEPEKLQLTLARIRSVVGEGNAGSPALLDTHRPDAFEIRPFAPPPAPPASSPAAAARLHLALRYFRPPRPACVRLDRDEPSHVAAPGVRGDVVEAAGPWRGSGGWWTSQPWAREEWDLALSGGGAYRVFRALDSGGWAVEGVYD